MDILDFEKLKTAIERKMTELLYLQKIYIAETGVSYIPGLSLNEPRGAESLKENVKG